MNYWRHIGDTVSQICKLLSSKIGAVYRLSSRVLIGDFGVSRPPPQKRAVLSSLQCSETRPIKGSSSIICIIPSSPSSSSSCRIASSRIFLDHLFVLLLYCVCKFCLSAFFGACHDDYVSNFKSWACFHVYELLPS